MKNIKICAICNSQKTEAFCLIRVSDTGFGSMDYKMIPICHDCQVSYFFQFWKWTRKDLNNYIKFQEKL